MKVRLLSAAKKDLEIAADFYESQCEGLGTEFIESISRDVELLEMHGGTHRLEHGFHKSISKRFPFAIYYLIEAQTVDIYAILDCRQDPAKTIGRLGS